MSPTNDSQGANEPAGSVDGTSAPSTTTGDASGRPQRRVSPSPLVLPRLQTRALSHPRSSPTEESSSTGSPTTTLTLRRGSAKAGGGTLPGTSAPAGGVFAGSEGAGLARNGHAVGRQSSHPPSPTGPPPRTTPSSSLKSLGKGFPPVAPHHPYPSSNPSSNHPSSSSSSGTSNASPHIPQLHVSASNPYPLPSPARVDPWSDVGLADGNASVSSAAAPAGLAGTARPRSWTLGPNRTPSVTSSPHLHGSFGSPTPGRGFGQRGSMVSGMLESPKTLMRKSFAALKGSHGAAGGGRRNGAMNGSLGHGEKPGGGGRQGVGSPTGGEWRRGGGWANRSRLARWVGILFSVVVLLWWIVRERRDASAVGDSRYVNPDLFKDRPSISRRLGIPGLHLGLSSRLFTSSNSHSHSFSSLISLPSSFDPVSTSRLDLDVTSHHRFAPSRPQEDSPTRAAEGDKLPSVGAVVHIPTPEKLASIDHLVSRLARQTVPLNSLTIVCTRMLSSSCRSALDRVGLEENGSLDPADVRIESYDPSAGGAVAKEFVAATEALVSLMAGLPTDLVLLVEGAARLPSQDAPAASDEGPSPDLDLGRGFLANLVRALGTIEYGGAVLGSAGAAFDRRSGSMGRQQAGHCRVQRPAAVSLAAIAAAGGAIGEEEDENAWASELEAEPLDVRWTTLQTTAVAVQLPSAPVLLRRSWLDLLARRRGVTKGELGPGTGLLRGDVPPAAALGLALWQHARIPSFSLPFGGSRLEQEVEEKAEEGQTFKGLRESFVEGPALEQECLNTLTALRRTPDAEAEVAKLFRGGGSGDAVSSRDAEPLRTSTATLEAGLAGAGTKDSGEPAHAAATDSSGRVAFMAASREELDSVLRPLACGLARRHEVAVFIPPSTTTDIAAGAAPQEDKVERIVYRFKGTIGSVCELHVFTLAARPSFSAKSIATLLDEGIGPDGGGVGRVPFDVVVYVEETVDPLVKAGMRMAGAVMEHARGRGVDERGRTLTAIGLPRDEIEYADWLAALSIRSLQNWHTPRFDIAVITNDRPYSLARLTTALQGAIYLGDRVHLNIHLEQTADLATQRLIDDLDWPHGTLTTRHRIVLGGLMPAIIESWYPAHNDSYGIILEDDVEVSPLFYAWLKFSILHFRYDPQQRAQSQRLFGVSLYQQRNIELRPEGRQHFDAHALFDSLGIPATTPYLSQIPCSWGAAYFPEVWREFHSYLALRLSEISLEISDVIVPEIRSNRWSRSWKKYFIELVFIRGYSMLYPNYPEFVSLSTNHMEKGTHIHVAAVDIKRRLQFEVPLMRVDESLLDLPDLVLPTWMAMPYLDLWGELVSEREAVERGWAGVALLKTCPTMWPLDRPLSFNARELLCRRQYAKREESLVALAARAAASVSS